MMNTTDKFIRDQALKLMKNPYTSQDQCKRLASALQMRNFVRLKKLLGKRRVPEPHFEVYITKEIADSDSLPSCFANFRAVQD